MNFAHPQLLWLLGLVPLLAWFLVVAWRRRQAAVRVFVQSRLLDTLTVGLSNGRRKARMVLSVVAVSLVVFALSRPQWGYEWDEARQQGLDIIVAIDASRSMLATDVRPNRLERAKLAALDLMKMARTDRVGLIAFAGTAFLQCPLTLDDGAFRQSVAALTPDIMPQGGTALAETIAVAMEAFKNEEQNHKVLVLLTDGEDHEAQAMEYAGEAAEQGLRIFTVGIGSPDGELIPLGREGGKEVYLKDDAGQVVKSRLNEALLQQIAGAAKGFYLNLSGAGAIETLYAQGLAPLPKGEISSRLVRVYFERFYWPLTAAVVLLLIEMFLPDRQRKRRDQGGARAAVAGLLLCLATSAGANPREAQRLFQSGRFGEAAELYQQARERSPEDARLAYNAGVAAYRAEDFETAQREFSSAVAAEEEGLQQSAWYNLGNTLFRMGKAEAGPDKKLESWKTALKMYDQALKLTPNAEDAEKNRTVLTRLVEELEKQMQQQQGDDSKDSEKKDDDQKENQSKDEPKQEKPDDPQQGNDSGNSKSDPSDESKSSPQKDNSDRKEEPSPSDKGNEEQEPPRPQPQEGQKKGDEDRKPEPQGGKGEEEDKKDGGEQQARPMPQPGKLSREQAMKMLESQRSFERPLIFRPPAERKTEGSQPITKTW